MIPLTLALKNFLSYGSEFQTINFTPYSFICLSGKNGHGKSALLDAMTWALWGQARKITGASRADESLLRLSQKQMLVIFTFIANGVHYRIKREFYKSPTKATAMLDFGFVDSSGRCIPLTTKTIKDTQQLIIDTIGLDFETFVNSSFLKQGSSNEFSKKSPKERKEIIGNILALDQYEIIKKKAVEKTRSISSQLEHIKISNQKRVEELKQYEGISSLLEINQDELIKLQQEELVLKTTLIKTDEHILKIRAQLHDFTTRLAIQKEQNKAYETLKNQLLHARKQWNQALLKKIQNRPADVLQKEQDHLKNLIKKQKLFFDAKIKIHDELSELEQQKKRIETHISEEHFKLQTLYVSQKEALLSEKNATEQTIQKIKNLENQETKAQEQYKKELAEKFEEQKKNNDHEKIIIFYTKRFEKRKELYQKLTLLRTQLDVQIADLETKYILFNNNQNTQCPLCASDLDIIKKNQCIDSLLQQKGGLEKKKDRVILLEKRLEKELKKQDDFKRFVADHSQKNEKITLTLHQLEFKKQESEQKSTQHQAEIKNLHHNLTLILEYINKQEKEFLEKISSLERNDQLRLFEQKIKVLQQTFDQNQYDKSVHEKAEEDLQIVERSLYLDHRALDIQLANVKEQMMTLCSLMKNKKAERPPDVLIHAISDLQLQEKEYMNCVQEIKELLSDHSAKKESLLQKKGTQEAQKKQQETLQKIVQEEEINIVKLQKELEQYLLISQATGKDGIQALLIEQAIPEIEYEANILLSRLSNNQMQIMIESLKDLKSGKTKETLDIKISDAEGVRNYELFSGGEAFRIDLSLRIAISKLLAHRAGTTLQTLIIDEGFGSQDEEGTSNIIDALYKIQEDFQKIIVVSHLNAIKEQIPVHFLVQKTAMGSSVSVVEQ